MWKTIYILFFLAVHVACDNVTENEKATEKPNPRKSNKTLDEIVYRNYNPKTTEIGIGKDFFSKFVSISTTLSKTEKEKFANSLWISYSNPIQADSLAPNISDLLYGLCTVKTPEGKVDTINKSILFYWSSGQKSKEYLRQLIYLVYARKYLFETVDDCKSYNKSNLNNKNTSTFCVKNPAGLFYIEKGTSEEFSALLKLCEWETQ